MGSLIKKTAGISGLTLMSRILGVIRDALIAAVFGSSAWADAFFMAFRPFDLMRKMFSDGVFSIAFVPELSGFLAAGRRDQAMAMIFSALFLLSVLAVLLVCGGILAAPFLVTVLAPGFAADPVKFDLTLVLLKIMMPYAGCIMLISLCMGVLNSLGSFGPPATAPVLFNLVVILSTLFAGNWFDVPVKGLALGVLAGGLVQLLLQAPFMIRRELSVPDGFVLFHPAVIRTAKKTLPCVVGAAAFQINMMLAAFFASFQAEGSVSCLYYADRLVQFPLALIAVSFSTVLLPFLSGKAAVRASEEIAGLFDAGIPVCMFVTIAATAGLLALDDWIVRFLFGHGEFDAVSVARTSECLSFLVLGLGAYTGSRLFATLHFAVGSIRAPFVAGLVAIGVNCAGSLVLSGVLGVRGAALSVSMASMVGFAVLAASRLPQVCVSLKVHVVSACRAVFLSVIMFFLVRPAGDFLIPYLAGAKGSMVGMGAGIAVCVALGVAVVALGARIMQYPELEMVKTLMKSGGN